MKLRLILESERDIFNSLAIHPIQSWEWGEFRQAQGHKVIRLGLFEKEKLSRVYQITFHKIPHTKYFIGHLAQCDLVTEEVIGELKKIGKENKAIFIKIEPAVVLTKEEREKEEKKLGSLGLIPAKPVFIRDTSEVDLTKNEEELLNSFKNKTRYNIHLAEKHGVSVQEDNSDTAFDNYLKLLLETTKRQGFYAHNEKFHQTQWQILHPAGISRLLTAAYQGKTLASFLIFIFNKVIYYPYGASTRDHREVMAPTLLMWEVIRLGKKLDCKKLDFWGDIEPESMPESHPLQGVHRFKEGFSPTMVKLIASHDLVINPKLYWFYNFLDHLRWKILRLKSKFS